MFSSILESLTRGFHPQLSRAVLLSSVEDHPPPATDENPVEELIDPPLVEDEDLAQPTEEAPTTTDQITREKVTETPTPAQTVPETDGYVILNVYPDWAFVDSHSEIAVVFTPIDKDFAFCRFGDIVVAGVVSIEDGKLRCKSPTHQEGNVKLAIAKDVHAFFGSADFSFVARPNQTKLWLWVVLFLFAVIAFLGFRKRGRWRQRRRVPLAITRQPSVFA